MPDLEARDDEVPEKPPPGRQHDRLLLTAMGLVSLVLILALLIATGVLSNRHDLKVVQDGRKTAIIASCSIYLGIIQAGQDSIRSGVLLPGDRLNGKTLVPGPLTKQLGKTYPPFPVRVVSAERAADAYEAKITKAVVGTLHEQKIASPVKVGKDGQPHIDCQKFKVVAKVS